MDLFFSSWYYLFRCSLDLNTPFVDNLPDRPKGGNYYPEDMSLPEFQEWLKELSASERADAEGFYHIIDRSVDGSLKIVPYSEAYKTYLDEASTLLRKAASHCSNTSLQKFLKSRSEAFLSNDYHESEVDWMDVDLNSPISVTIGPYEVYRDELLNYKASFECFLGITDIDETKKLSIFESKLQDIENSLPMDDKYKNPSVGKSSPMIVIDQIFSSGDVGGPQTSAFNLPNDENVVQLKGSKKILLKNVQEEKFKHIMVPIAELLIHPSQQQYISFDAFFTHILCHEVVHGIGPHIINKDGEASTVRKELQDIHSALEEAKADIAGLFTLQQFMESGLLDTSLEKSLYVTFLAGAFRSIRFGLNEAHGIGQALQLTYLLENKAVVYHQDTKSYSIDFDNINNTVKDLTRIILTIQATGDKSAGQQLLDKYGINMSHVSDALERISHIPIDIYPSYPVVKELSWH